eukprot:13787323-Alexandrium_andersonii.AAC.1
MERARPIRTFIADGLGSDLIGCRHFGSGIAVVRQLPEQRGVAYGGLATATPKGCATAGTPGRSPHHCRRSA